MKKRTKRLLLLSAVVFIALLATTCGMVVGHLEPGYNLVLTVGDSSMSRLVEVTNYDVTRLHLLVTRPDPDGEGGLEPEIVDDFDWYPDDGMMRYVVNLGETGDYVLTVTHFCLVDGVETTAEETANFEIRHMKITMINIIPGAVGVIDVEPPPDEPPAGLEGFWFGSTVPFWGGPGMEVIDVYGRFGPDDRYGMKLYAVGEVSPDFLIPFSSFGTYDTVAGDFVSEPDALYYQDWSTGDPPEWMTVTGPIDGWYSPPHTLDGDTFTLHQYMDGVDYDWVMTRLTDVEDSLGVWTGVGQIVPGGYIDVEFSMLADGTYEIIMYDGDPAIVDDMSTKGYWWIAGDNIVLDVMEIHWGGWVSPADVGLDGWAYVSPYFIDEFGALHLTIDFQNDGSIIGEWVLDPAP